MIKFRAWDKENKEMVEVELLGKRVLLVKDGEWENIENFEVMQYTGLKDKNGKEIYEGDLLKHPTGVVAEIKYENDVASFVAVYTANDDMEMNHLDREIIKKCEVVGNIFENPELLEVEGEMNEICPTCNGSGGIDTFEESIGEVVTITCPDCGGSGVSDD